MNKSLMSKTLIQKQKSLQIMTVEFKMLETKADGMIAGLNDIISMRKGDMNKE